MDVAFFSVDNPSYLPTNMIFSSNSQGQSICLGTTYRAAAIGNTYKDGNETHLTSATVTGSNVGTYFVNGFYFYGLLKTTNNAAAGDSGGPAFIMDSSTSGKVVGIVMGGDANNTYYTQAACIDYNFGAMVY